MKLTEKRIEENTFFSKQTYERMKKNIEKYENDPDKQYRESVCLCKTCHYLRQGQIVGHSMTKYTCKDCEREEVHENTGVPKYCSKCANTHSICKRCGSSL